MNLIFIRHGETKYPIDTLGNALVYGPSAELTDQGKFDVEMLARTLRSREIQPERLYSSTYRRAMDTAMILWNILNISEYRVDPNLRDVDVPQYLGKVVGTTPEDYYAGQLPEGHESLEQLTARSLQSVKTILEHHAYDKTIMIVSHRDTILSVLYALENGRPAGSLEELVSISPLERGEGVIVHRTDEGIFRIEERLCLETHRSRKE